MSRPIQIGDLALIHTGKIPQEYSIVGIIPQGILVSSHGLPGQVSLIIPTKQGWKVYGLDSPHTLEFQEPHIELTELPSELLIEQLILLQIEDVLSACETNRQFNEICQRRDFWYRRIQKDFPEYNLAPPSEVSDPRRLYIQLYRAPIDAVREEIFTHLKHLNLTGENAFWVIDPTPLAARPHLAYHSSGTPYFTLRTANVYVLSEYRGRRGYDKFVLWPDLRLAGTVNHIVQLLRKAGLKTVPVGELYRLTDGRIGSPPGRYPLTEQLIYENSVIPWDPDRGLRPEEIVHQIDKEFMTPEDRWNLFFGH